MLPFIEDNIDERLPKPAGYDERRTELEARLRDVFKVIPIDETAQSATTQPITELEQWEADREPA